MSEAIGPRVYLLGKILPVVISLRTRDETKTLDEDVESATAYALKIVDAALEKMQWPEGKPKP